MNKNITSVLTELAIDTPDTRDLVKESHITLRTKIPPVRPSIIIDETMVCTEGGILLVSGQKKAGKSNAIVFILATALMDQVDTQKTLLIRTVKQTKKIIYIDTEQAPAKTQEFLNRVHRIAGLKNESEQLEFYNIRKLEIEERIKMLESILKRNEEIGLLVVDGVADLVGDINDINKATSLGDLIFKYLNDQMTFVTSIHEGKAGTGAMGHIGQFMEKKCSGTIALFKDRKKQVHTMQCKLVREGAEFKDIDFIWSDQDKGFILMNEAMKEAIREDNEERELFQLRHLFGVIYMNKTELNQTDLRDRVIGHDTTIKVSSSDANKKRTALRRIEKALDMGVIHISKEESKTKFYKLK